ncbi:MAG TPA: hypothetical protein VMS95_04380 [Candidatus Krumholzibacteriaceae bacterium]|nr:hypothetical protein [Candidatus Krumholzibacteriaceae bacterium]
MNTSTLDFQGLKIKHNNENEGTRLTKWFLNGPKTRVFRRVTERKVQGRFVRERLGSNEEKIDTIEIPIDSSSGGGGDFLLIKAFDFQFVVAKVPKKYGPSWSSNICIEYQKAWGRIPEMEETEKIEELCSFIFGTQLLSVGYTLYDKNESVVEEYAISPWGKKRSRCVHLIMTSLRSESMIPQEAKLARALMM